VVRKRFVLRFGADTVGEPIICSLVKRYDLVINILKANISPENEGTMVVEVAGREGTDGLEYLRSRNVTVRALAEEIVRNEDRCTSCGACTAICPSGGLYLERPGMEVGFDGDSCVVCHLCVKACPVRAMEVRF